MNAALAYLRRDYYLNYPIIRAIEEGFNLVHGDDDGVLVTTEAPIFAWFSASNPRRVLEGVPPPSAMEVFGAEAGAFARELYGFTRCLPCYQYYYPHDSIESDFELQPATLEDAPFIDAHYPRADLEEIQELIGMNYLWLARDEQNIIGFIGRHQEGSMGLLEIMPAYRRQGWGGRLIKALTKIVLAEGTLPYGHVVVGNDASKNLQEKLGFKCCNDLMYWMWHHEDPS